MISKERLLELKWNAEHAMGPHDCVPIHAHELLPWIDWTLEAKEILVDIVSKRS